MAAAQGGARTRGRGVVQLLVDIDNTDAIAWYRARGFRVVTAYTEEDGTRCVRARCPGRRPYVPTRVAARAAPRDAQTPQAAVHAGGPRNSDAEPAGAARCEASQPHAGVQ